MKNRLCIIVLLLLAIVCIIHAQGNSIPDYKNQQMPIERRVQDLLGRMTLEEKIAQLQCLLGEVELEKQIGENGIGGLGCSVRPFEAKKAAERMNEIQRFFIEKTRLGIPVIMHDEALHGLIANKATSFPQAIALAATWDMELMSKVAGVIAIETKSRGIRQVLSPVVNIARDARWGRVEETYGEDPYLSARMGVEFCKAFEKIGVVTTPKHFVANDGDGGRDSNPTHFNERLLREIYFPPFRACFLEAGSQSVMAAYNSLDGTPCSSNHWLLSKILRGEWGFKGFVVSDYGSVGGIFDLHHTAATAKETASQALKAGLEVELPNRYYYAAPMLEAVREGLVPKATLDEAVSRILAVKFRIGLFEQPYVDVIEAERINDAPEFRQVALQAARESMVLLKNESKVLPLKKEIRRLAVIGPDAESVRLGGYSGFGMRTVSILDGLREKLGAERIVYEKGFNLKAEVFPAISDAYLSTEDGQKGLKAEYFNNITFSGIPELVRIDPQIQFSWGMAQPHFLIHGDRFSVRWTGFLQGPASSVVRLSITSDDGVRLWIDDQLLIEKWYDRGATTDVVSYRFEKDRKYKIRIEYYENAGDAYAGLGWDFGKKDESIQKKALAIAKNSDAVVIVAGILEGEGQDRAVLDLSDAQEQLIRAVAETGKPTIVVLIGGSAITMSDWLHTVSSVLMAWYPGEEGGHAVADVLFGDYNPGGKLPLTFPQAIGQVPLYYNHKPTGRGYGYIQMSGDPQFAFGHGLSYSEFQYSDLKIDPLKVAIGSTVKFSITIKNNSTIAGDEVVQLYLHDVIGSVSRPVKQLVRFQRVHIPPGEMRILEGELTPDDLSLWDANLKWVQEPGVYEVMIGSSSADIRSKSSFIVE